MKKDAVLLNLGRGGIIDDEALAEAIENDEIGAVGLDVLNGKRNNIVPDGNRTGEVQYLCNPEGRGLGEQSVASSHGAHGYRSRIRFQGGIYGTGGCGLSLRARKL